MVILCLVNKFQFVEKNSGIFFVNSLVGNGIFFVNTCQITRVCKHTRVFVFCVILTCRILFYISSSSEMYRQHNPHSLRRPTRRSSRSLWRLVRPYPSFCTLPLYERRFFTPASAYTAFLRMIWGFAQRRIAPNGSPKAPWSIVLIY